MNTYDAFGTYKEPVSGQDVKGEISISLPENIYDFEITNISTSKRNGLFIWLKIGGVTGDPGDELENPNLNFISEILNLTDIQGKRLTSNNPSVNVNNFNFNNPFFVFIFHDKDDTNLQRYKEERHLGLNTYNPKTKQPSITILEPHTPSRFGFGGLKKV